MNIMTFTYNKDGELSDRVFIPLVNPTNKYFGIDISELEVVDQVAFDEEVFRIQDEQKAKMDALMEKYDCKYKYRAFFPEKMTNVVFEKD